MVIERGGPSRWVVSPVSTITIGFDADQYDLHHCFSPEEHFHLVGTSHESVIRLMDTGIKPPLVHILGAGPPKTEILFCPECVLAYTRQTGVEVLWTVP